MSKRNFQQVIEAILKDDNRYAMGAYIFVRMALDYTVKKLNAENPSRMTQHVSAREFLEGIRVFALETFGPMAKVLFDEWGLKSCSDVGEIVFNLINIGEFRRTEDDKREDFNGLYDFNEAFVLPFMPKSKASKSRRKK